jgi:pimeloyl-ACP methyl ester carboxylesterase
LMPQGWQTQRLNWPGAGVEAHDPRIDGYEDLVQKAATEVADGSDVVAQSMGGVVAVGLALAYPHKIRRLVLVATSGGLDVRPLGGEDWRAEYDSEFPDAASWVTGPVADHMPDLGCIAIPTCLIWGEDDPISPVAVGETLARALPHSRLHVIQGGTHILAREQPADVAKLIIEHLR